MAPTLPVPPEVSSRFRQDPAPSQQKSSELIHPLTDNPPRVDSMPYATRPDSLGEWLTPLHASGLQIFRISARMMKARPVNDMALYCEQSRVLNRLQTRLQGRDDRSSRRFLML